MRHLLFAAGAAALVAIGAGAQAPQTGQPSSSKAGAGRTPDGHPNLAGTWSFAIDLPRMLALVKLGGPAALQLGLELGVFAAASALAARITPLALAANQIVLNIASFVFMVPLGINSAAAVRVGQAIGRRDPHGARLSGWTALGVGAVVMAVFSVVFFTAPRALLAIFTRDSAVLSVGTTVLFIYAAFQIFDALQVIATGALRGLGDTHTPMAMNFVGHWLVGLPLAYYLCFSRQWGVAGLWFGLSIGLTLVGLALVLVWRWRSRAATILGSSR